MKIAVYPGSFDPITLGHLDVITRASKLFEKVIMAVVTNPNKTPFIDIEDRVRLAEECTESLANVEVTAFEGLTVELANRLKAGVIIRGLRAVSDFEYEFMMAQMNKSLNDDVETVFLAADTDYQFLTSSVVKEVAKLGGDVSANVPAPVLKYLDQCFDADVKGGQAS